MAAIREKKKNVSLSGVLAAAKKLTVEEKHLLKMKLFGDEFIKQARAFDVAMKKKRPSVKKTDEEIVKAVRRIRAKNAAAFAMIPKTTFYTISVFKIIASFY